MGCLYACLLSDKNEVLLLDIDKNTVDTINQNGIFMKEKDSDAEKNYKIKAQISGEAVGIFDLLIVFVKDTATRAALECNKHLISADTTLLSLQNGLGNFEIVQEFAEKSQILLGTTKHNCVTLSPGKVYHSGSGVTHIGSPAGNANTAEKIVAAFSDSNIEAEKCDNVKHLLWEKLFINMTINSVTALLNAHINIISEDEHARRVVAKLLSEAVAVALKDGVKFDYDTVYQALMNSVWADQDYIVLKFGSDQGYQSAKYELFENGMLSDAGQYLMEVYGTQSWNYRYNTDDEFRLITIYWK